MNIFAKSNENIGYFLKTKGHLKSKDIKSALNLYDRFVDDYAELNDKYGFNSSVAIATAFNYWLNFGSLSKHRFYNEDAVKPVEMDNLLGSNVMTGSKVSSHTATLLIDTMNKNGIEAHTVTIEALESFLPEYYGFSILGKGAGFGQKIENDEENTFTMAVENGKTLIFDTLAGKVIVPRFEKVFDIVSENSIKTEKVPFDLGFGSTTISDYEAGDLLKGETFSTEEVQSICSETLGVCQKNPYLIVRFYSQHEGDYEQMEGLHRRINKGTAKVKSPSYIRTKY